MLLAEFNSLEAINHRSASLLFHMGLSNMVAYFVKTKKEDDLLEWQKSQLYVA